MAKWQKKNKKNEIASFSFNQKLSETKYPSIHPYSITAHPLPSIAECTRLFQRWGEGEVHSWISPCWFTLTHTNYTKCLSLDDGREPSEDLFCTSTHLAERHSRTGLNVMFSIIVKNCSPDYSTCEMYWNFYCWIRSVQFNLMTLHHLICWKGKNAKGKVCYISEVIATADLR